MAGDAATVSVGTDRKLSIYPTPDDLPEHFRCYAAPIPGTTLYNFHHPLFVTLFPVASPLPLEDFIAFRKAHADEHLANGNLARYVFSHERAYRMECLQRLADTGAFENTARSSVQFWKIAANVWVDAEHSEDDPCWSNLMETPIANRWAMTKSRDRRALREMDDHVTLYRGVHSHDVTDIDDAATSGWSWSLSARTARFFAKRFLPRGMTAVVVAADVPKTLIRGYLTSRNEQEMLVAPGEIEPGQLRIYND